MAIKHKCPVQALSQKLSSFPAADGNHCWELQEFLGAPRLHFPFVALPEPLGKRSHLLWLKARLEESQQKMCLSECQPGEERE